MEVATEPVGPVDRLPKAHRSRVDRALRDYLTQGGFPEAQGLETRERLELLKGYVDATMLRDVVERHAVSQPIALRWMVRHLLANAAGSFSVHKFHADLRSQGFAVAKDTLHAFVAHLEDAFLIRTVSVATESERRRMANPRKAYPIDPGLIAVFDRSGRANVGHALETAVALELDRRLRAADEPVVSVACHPGYSDTALQSTGPGALAPNRSSPTAAPPVPT